MNTKAIETVTPKPKTDKEIAAELLAKFQARQAKRDARRAEAAARAETQAKIKEARKAAGEALKSPEEKAADFKRLAKERTAAAIKRIRMIGHLSAKASYAYTDEQITVIEKLLEQELRNMLGRFRSVGSVTDIEVNL